VSDAGYTIAWTGPAQRALRKLPEKAATAAVEFIYGSLADNPQRVGKPLRYELAGLHSARRGGYRVIYRISADHRTIEIVAIEHRADAYRPH
jgi:mRNA-degrading endonuclease RelE of RelBE toxin-antitoxin system